MSATTGLLSQSIQNIQTTIANLSAISGLPQGAQDISSSAISLLQGEITKITSLQSAVAKFVNDSLLQLQQVQTDLNNNTNGSQDATIISNVNAAAAALTQNVNALDADINSTKAQLVTLSNNLNPIQSQLNSQQVSLNTQLQSAQQQADEIESKEKYFLLLGILGLPGLAAAAIALAVENNTVSGLEAQVSSIKAQLSNLAMMTQAVGALNNNFNDIVSKVSDVKNAVEFVASDTTQITTDLSNGQAGIGNAKLYVVTTISELQTLQQDAA